MNDLFEIWWREHGSELFTIDAKEAARRAWEAGYTQAWCESEKEKGLRR